MSIPTLLRKYRGFRRLWLAQIVSEVGDWFQIVPLLVWIERTSGSGTQLSLFFLVRMAPSVLLAPLAGVVADRFPRRTVMILTDLGRVATCLAMLGVRGPADLPRVFALLFVQESLSALFEPARSAAIPELVPTEALGAANLLAGATWSACVALGAAAGGWISTLVGLDVALLIDAGSFLLSALLLLGVPAPRHTATDPRPTRSARGDLVAAWRYVRSTPGMTMLVALKGGWGLGGGILLLLYTVFVTRVFHEGTASGMAMGWLYAARGSGALVGPFAAQAWIGRGTAAVARSLLFAFPVAISGIVSLALAPAFPPAIAAVFLAHFGGSVVWVFSTQLIQATAPNAIQGRLFAADQALFTAALALASGAAGHALDHGVAPRHLALAAAVVLLLPWFGWWRLGIAWRRH